MKFRKKPVVIEAEQLLEGMPVPEGICTKRDCVYNLLQPHMHTLEGPLMTSVGDWIIIGIKGERYPCKPDIFEATYEVAE